ncbi:isotrichodermin C-15 hydroxylase [Hypoxylon sp. NC1633]|nr:isotrichodermin C-15 hydroxylase [Hypoxylon sp. NC1633]
MWDTVLYVFQSVGKAVALTFAAISLYLLFCVLYNYLFHPLRRFPGPLLWRITPFPRAAALLRGTLALDVAKFQKRYGPVVRIGPSELAFITADAWKDVYGAPATGDEENPKDYRFYRLVKSAPPSIINANFEEHSRLRHWLSHGFSDRSLQAQQGIIGGYLNWTTFDIIGNLGFGSDFGCLENVTYAPWILNINDTMKKGVIVQALAYIGLTPIIQWLVERAQSGYMAHREFARLRVEQRIELSPSRPDFLEGLLDKGIEIPQLGSIASTLLIAGSETSATLLSGALYLLTTHPNTLKKLAHEVRSTFKNEEEINLLSVRKLPYMLACLKESLRKCKLTISNVLFSKQLTRLLNPPVANGMPRVAKPGGTTVAGYHVPEDTTIAVWQWAINHNSEYWSDPYSFEPERWTGGDSRFSNDRLDAAQPFLLGHRGCIGQTLAYAEMRLILARIVYAFDLRLSDESKDWINVQKNYLLWEKPDLGVYLTPATIKS